MQCHFRPNVAVLHLVAHACPQDAANPKVMPVGQHIGSRVVRWRNFYWRKAYIKSLQRTSMYPTFKLSSLSTIQPTMSNDVTSLHNYLQNKKQTHTLTWAESYTGPCNQVTWTVHCKIGGEIKGTGKGATISDAKHMAAKQALAALKAAETAN